MTEQATLSEGRSLLLHGAIELFAFATVIGIAVIVIHFLTSHAGPAPDQSAKVAAQSGADYCSDTGYAIVSKLSNVKTAIYDCQFAGRSKCVTYENGLTSDQTDVVRLLFTSVLGSSKPSCLTG